MTKENRHEAPLLFCFPPLTRRGARVAGGAVWRRRLDHPVTLRVPPLLDEEGNPLLRASR